MARGFPMGIRSVMGRRGNGNGVSWSPPDHQRSIGAHSHIIVGSEAATGRHPGRQRNGFSVDRYPCSTSRPGRLSSNAWRCGDHEGVPLAQSKPSPDTETPHLADQGVQRPRSPPGGCRHSTHLECGRGCACGSPWGESGPKSSRSSSGTAHSHPEGSKGGNAWPPRVLSPPWWVPCIALFIVDGTS